MAVPLLQLDRSDPALLRDLVEIVEQVASEGAFTMGRPVESFERRFAAYCGGAEAVGVASGTSALELALRGLGIGRGDEVVVPTNSFIATAEAVSMAGAVPRLVDVDEETSLIDAEIVAAALGPRTRCVIPVHLYGRTVEMDPILALCRERGVAVIEDACQAHGAWYRGRRVGTLGNAACFSFYPTKNLGGWGDGGAVVTDDEELASRLRALRSHGEGPRHHHAVVSGTFRLDGLQAAILEHKLRRLDGWNDGRRAAGAALREALAESPVVPPPTTGDGDHVFHLFVVRSPDRDRLREHLEAREIATAIHYPTPIHLQPAYAGLGLGPGSLPVSERLAGEICSLPLFPALEGSQIEAIVTAVREFSVVDSAASAS
ncbi:MAG TPA: DegT/DnrJ/EryC1/StrS family aminotransferase [Solirubrobacterales bacterium]